MTEAILKRIDESLAEIEALKPTKPRGGKCPYPPCTKEREEYYQSLYQNAQDRARRIRELAMVCRPKEIMAFRVAVENLKNMQRHWNAICPEPMPLGLESTMGLMMSQTESKIALILGVTEGK